MKKVFRPFWPRSKQNTQHKYTFAKPDSIRNGGFAASERQQKDLGLIWMCAQARIV